MEFSYSTFQDTKNKLIQEYTTNLHYLPLQSNPPFNIQLYKRILDTLQIKKCQSLAKITRINRPQLSNRANVAAMQASCIFLTEFAKQQECSQAMQPELINAIENKNNQIEEQINIRSKLQQKSGQLENTICLMKKQVECIKWQLESKQANKSSIQQILQETKSSYLNLINYSKNAKKQVLNTSKFFKRSLSGRNNTRLNTRRKNMIELDEVTQAVIKIDKLKNTLQHQHQIIHNYQHQSQIIHQKLSRYRQLTHKYRQVILISSFVQEIEKSPTKQTIAKYRKIDLSIDILEQRNITKRVIDFYKRLKAQEIDLNNHYIMNLNQLEEKKKDLFKVNQAETIALTQQNSQKLQYKIVQMAGTSILNHSNITFYQNKIQQLGMNILQFYDRILFFLRRQITSLKRIIQYWLKFDKSASNFIKQVEFEVYQLLNNINEPISQSESKHYLVSSFEKWQNYVFFLQSIQKNPFIYRYLNKQLLCNHLKRIIKTKINHPQFCTQQLFMISISEIQDSSQLYYRQKIKKIFSLLDKINKYGSKFQVLIVNIKQNDVRNIQQKESQKLNIKAEKQQQIIFKNQNNNELNKTYNGRINFKGNNRKIKIPNQDFQFHDQLQKQFNKVSKII